MRNEKGFSLIEMLIVVVIVGIIAAIAIPNLISSRRAANEASAISSLRMLHGAQHTYSTSHGSGNFAGEVPGVNGLPILAGVNLIDSVLSSGQKSGYQFETFAEPTTDVNPSSFVVSSRAIARSGFLQSGTRDFLIGTGGVIVYDDLDNTNSMGWSSVGGLIVISGGIPLGQ